MTATKAKRTLEVMTRLDRTYIPVVLVREGKKSDAYCVFSYDDRISWQHRGDVTRSHTVTCVAGMPNACDCDGFRRWQRCRHVAGSRVLIRVEELRVGDDERPEGWMHTTEAD